MARKSQAQLVREAEGLLGVHKHKSLTGKCIHCAGPHTTSQHASHGKGSFERTHGNTEHRLGKELHGKGAEELLMLLEPYPGLRRGRKSKR